jgi:AraC family transcriptional regulator
LSWRDQVAHNCLDIIPARVPRLFVMCNQAAWQEDIFESYTSRVNFVPKQTRHPDRAALAETSAPQSRRMSRRADSDVCLVDLKQKSWPGITAEFVRISSPAEYDFRLQNSPGYLTLLDIYRIDGESVAPGLPRSSRQDLRSKLTYIPPGSELRGRSRILGQATVTAVYFDWDDRDDSRDLLQLPPMLHFEDNMLRTLLTQLQAVILDPTIDISGYAETLGLLMHFEMQRLGNQLAEPAPLQGGLTSRQIRLVVDHLENCLQEKITIAELSRIVELSRFHFIRAFKKSLGMTPHQFIANRRVERARDLLTKGRMSVSEIAASIGFNSTAQLTRAFRRHVGTTPTLFRRNA